MNKNVQNKCEKLNLRIWEKQKGERTKWDLLIRNTEIQRLIWERQKETQALAHKNSESDRQQGAKCLTAESREE